MVLSLFQTVSSFFQRKQNTPNELVRNYSVDFNISCKETYHVFPTSSKHDTYTMTYYEKRNKSNIVGTEQGFRKDGKKNGDYVRTFFCMYIESDLLERFLWEESPLLRNSIRVEESGTYLNDQREGDYIRLFFLRSKLICEEKGKYKDNQKHGEFTRRYYGEKSIICEYGTIDTNGQIDTVLENFDRNRRLQYRTTMKIRTYRDERTTFFNYTLRRKCDYTMQTKHRYEHGSYSYNVFDVQYHLCRRQPICRRGIFFYEHRVVNYRGIVSRIWDKNLLPVELEDYVNLYLHADPNPKMGCFLKDKKIEAQYTKKTRCSPDGKYILVDNIYDHHDNKMKTILFDKNLLENSSLFDNQTGCLISTLQIKYINRRSKFYEPVFKICSEYDSSPLSVIRFLFEKKGFKGHVVFRNGNRNFITKDNIQFLSRRQFCQVKNTVTTFQRNENVERT